MAEEDSSSSSESFNSDISISEDVNVSPNANQLDVSSVTLNNGEESPDDPKQGYIELKDYVKKNKLIDKWKLSWCLLDGSSLFVYKNYEVCVN
jgi:hypothetical protein